MTAQEELAALLKGVKAVSVLQKHRQIVHLYQPEDLPEVKKKLHRAMLAGHEVEWPDGTLEWYELDPIWKNGKIGQAEGFHWDETRNRIHCNRVHFTQHKRGEMPERKIIGRTWVDYLTWAGS